ncbi:HigA family addiction module antitoxin [Flaviaesturariibacter amylovorans]|uniref:HigA family addiction module antitoxin n=1 Tax=Flaviaesturariibacter amylovorans TaxID=1084520 RepID=A0ABP8HP31_9BACT
MATKIANIVPAHAIHPGEVLKDELYARDIKQKDFAELTGIQPSQLNEIINKKRGINAEHALLIGKALEMDSQLWLNLQTNYDLDLARVNEKIQAKLSDIEMWQQIRAFVPEKYLRRLGYFHGNLREDVNILKSIYHIDNLGQLQGALVAMNHARLRKSQNLDFDPKNLFAWLKILDFEAGQIEVPPFKKESESQLIDLLRDAIWKNKDTVQTVKQILESHGIKMIILENPEKCPIDGCAFWNGESPAIGLTMRHNRIDNFAFTLFHELGHIFLHLANNRLAEFVDFDLDSTADQGLEEERQADNFAKDILINPELWLAFLKSPDKFQEKAMINMARKAKTHPAIIKGRLSHELQNYRIKTRFNHNLN